MRLLLRGGAWALSLISVLIIAGHTGAAEVESSVVKLSVTKREPDHFRPWTKASPSKVSGSGVVIGSASPHEARRTRATRVRRTTDV